MPADVLAWAQFLPRIQRPDCILQTFPQAIAGRLATIDARNSVPKRRGSQWQFSNAETSFTITFNFAGIQIDMGGMRSGAAQHEGVSAGVEQQV